MTWSFQYRPVWRMYHPAKSEPPAMQIELGIRCAPALPEVVSRTAVKKRGTLKSWT